MSINRIVSIRSALKANPRHLSVTLYPSEAASCLRRSGSTLDISNNRYKAGVEQYLDVITAQTQLEGAQSQQIAIGVTRATLYVLLPVTHQHGNVDWQRAAPHYRRVALEQLRKVGVDDVEKRLRFEHMVTPADWDRMRAAVTVR